MGVLAHNEESRIGEMLRSLFAQDVFERFPTELVIVANGCTDRTAVVAQRSIEDHHAVWSARGSARVQVLGVAGKANAWNEFVHQISSPHAPVLVLMDADISFLTTDTISTMVTTLQNKPQAVVCVDRPVKDIEIRADRTLLERLLVATTPKIDPDDVPLCGQLYCARSEQLRPIKLPVELPGEDGFLRALLLTKGFTAPEDRSRIILAPRVAHCFASVATLRELFNHEKWLVTSSILNMLLFERFWAESRPSRNAMKLMEEWYKFDANWLPHYIESQVQARGWRLLPRAWWTRRWSRLKGLPTGRIVRRLPITAVAAAVDAAIFVAAIMDVRQGRAYRYWRRH